MISIAAIGIQKNQQKKEFTKLAVVI